jgi:hypothetical protein
MGIPPWSISGLNFLTSLPKPGRSWPLLILHNLRQDGINPSLPTWPLISEVSDDNRTKADRHRHFLRRLLRAAMFAEFGENIRRQNVPLLSQNPSASLGIIGVGLFSRGHSS